MKTILFFILLIILIVTVESVLSLDVNNLSEYDQGYLIGKFILMLACVAGLIITGRSIFRNYVQ